MFSLKIQYVDIYWLGEITNAAQSARENDIRVSHVPAGQGTAVRTP